ncbi:hypothetical protein SEA_KNOCKER_64 [Mycobacterium phage Knocker]|nr:hypothetical protein SEA_KNOCKER_64 [Mycobacterium phage Knocker]
MTPNLPARAGFGAHDVPLSAAPTAALAFALGYAIARPIEANTFGPFCAMVEELEHRPAGVLMDGTTLNEWTRLLSLLPPDVARRVVLLYQAQRGQRWARTGHRHGTTPTDTGNT